MTSGEEQVEVSLHRGLWTLGFGAFRSFQRHQVTLLGAGIAYYALFSLIPLLALSISIAGLILRDEATRRRFVNWLIDQAPFTLTAENRADLARAIESAADVSGIGAVVAVALVIWSSSSVFSAVRRGLNVVFEVEGRAFFHAKLKDMVMLPTLGLLFLGSLAVTTLIQTAINITDEALPWLALEENLLLRVAVFLVPFVLSTLVFVVAYKVLPNVYLPWRTLLIASIFAGVLLEASKHVLAFYLVTFGDRGIYGGVATIFAFLFWAYVSSVIVLLGGELAAQHLRMVREGVHVRARLPSRRAFSEPIRRLRAASWRQ